MGPEDPRDDGGLLLAFLAERDVPCPLCGYNLRNLTRPQCPECRKDLALTVGVKKLNFLWLLATITPGLFSGIAAGLLLIVMTIATFLGGGGPVPWQVHVLDAFGWLSGLAALLLIKYRFAFLRQPQGAQQAWAAVAWAVHLGAFAVMMALAWIF